MLAFVVFILVTACALILPLVVYAVVTLRSFGLLSLSSYMPVEELRAAFASLRPAEIWNAPVVSVNMMSGEVISAMYEATVGSLLLAVSLGAACAVTALRPASCRLKRAGAFGGTTLAAGIGAGIVGAPTMLLGCCGGGLAGALLSLAGMGSAAAADLSTWGQPVQAASVALMLALGVPPHWRRGR